MAGAHLQVDNVEVAYGDALAVRNVSVTVEPGAALGIVGPNGAGKTSLFNCIMGLVPARSGAIRFLGKDVTRRPAWDRARRGMQLVIDNGAVFGDMTVTENMNVALAGSRRGEELATELAALFPRLQERRDVPAGKLSGGEQRMLAVARALARDPALLMLDEVTSGLAAKVTEGLADYLADLRRTSGIAVIVAGEDLRFIRRTCDEVVFAQQGILTHRHAADRLDDREFVQANYFGDVPG